MQPMTAKLAHNEVILNLPEDHIIAYTDASCKHKKYSAAIYIPAKQTREKYLIHGAQSTTEAELTAIKLALEKIYQDDDYHSFVQIFTDSYTAVQNLKRMHVKTMERNLWEINNLVNALWNSGSKTTITWIPSHAGIEGNEIADQLANEALQDTNIPEIQLHPHYNQAKLQLQKNIKEDWLTKLNLSGQKIATCTKSIQLDSNRFHEERRISVTLHRLRTERNQLGYWMNKLDPYTSDSCRWGCEEPETTEHVLFTCREHREARQKLHEYATRNNIPWNKESLLGLNDEITTRKKRNTTNRLGHYLTKTKIKYYV